jgi:hypothetical protein
MHCRPSGAQAKARQGLALGGAARGTSWHHLARSSRAADAPWQGAEHFFAGRKGLSGFGLCQEKYSATSGKVAEHFGRDSSGQPGGNTSAPKQSAGPAVTLFPARSGSCRGSCRSSSAARGRSSGRRTGRQQAGSRSADTVFRPRGSGALSRDVRGARPTTSWTDEVRIQRPGRVSWLLTRSCRSAATRQAEPPRGTA